MHKLNIKSVLGGVKREVVRKNAVLLVNVFHGGIWNLRNKCLTSERNRRRYAALYEMYLEHYGAWIGLGAQIQQPPILPHGLHGIFISNSAKIGKNVVIFHHVTIGSNMLKGSSRIGAPSVSDNVYIGCGAKLIGDISIGENARIGANAIVVKDVPANSVTVTKGTVTIIRNETLDNEWIPNHG